MSRTTLVPPSRIGDSRPPDCSIYLTQDPPSPSARQRKTCQRSAADARALEQNATALLRTHTHLQDFHSYVRVKWIAPCLCLQGYLPSFFLKQLAQEALRKIPDVAIDNQIIVAEELENAQPFTVGEADEMDRWLRETV